MNQQYLDKWVEWLMSHKGPYDIHVTNAIILGLLDKIDVMGQSFLEYGYGTGFTAIALANRGKNVIAYDPAIGLIEHAMKARTAYINANAGPLVFTCDKLSLSKHNTRDVVYSQGLLEHFSDTEIVEIINDQLSYAGKAVVFSVPSDAYPQQDFGDERLLSIAEWERILEPFKDRLTQLYYYERNQHLMGVIKKWDNMKIRTS